MVTLNKSRSNILDKFKKFEDVNTNHEETLIVMCNGPSLANADFEELRKYNTFGMNGAYRYYYKNNWWPNYFACFDRLVTNNHAPSYVKMINDPEVPIERFFLLLPIVNNPKLTVLPLNGALYTFSTDFKTFSNGGNTGANSCQAGICMGYKKIILLGADCNYVEVVDGAEGFKAGGRWPQLKMVKTPDKNPNYFMSDYQQEGDVYNYPQAAKFHQPGWNSLSDFAFKNDIDIVNCSDISTLTCFRKSTLEKELSLIV
jgi:hypothetical protein